MEIQPRESAAQAQDPQIEVIGSLAGSPKTPETGAPDVDTLVSDFLEELDAVSAALAAPSESSAHPAIEIAHPSMPSDDGIETLLPSWSHAEKDDGAGDEDAFCADVEDELSRTLNEIEARAKSKVIPLTMRESSRPQLHPRSEAVPQPESQPLPATGESFAAEAPTDEPELQPSAKPAIARTNIPVVEKPRARAAITLDSSFRAILTTPSPHASLWNRIVIACGIAAVIIVLAGGVYYFLNLAEPAADHNATPMSGTKAQSSPGRAGSPPTEGAPTAAGLPDRDVPTTPPATNRPPGASGLPPRKSPSQASNPLSPNASRPAAPQRSNPQVGTSTITEPAGTRPPAGQTDATPARELPVQTSADRTLPPVTANPPTPPVTPPPATSGETGAAAAKNTEQPPGTAVKTQPQLTQTDAGKTASEQPPAGSPPASISDRPVNPPVSPPAGRAGGSERNPSTEVTKTAPGSIATVAVPLTRVTPNYPALASRMNVKGKVELIVTIDERGNVVKATAVNGPLVLRPAAEEALMKWRFRPATLRGTNVGSELNVSVDFKQ